MIRKLGKVWVLDTARTTYCFALTETGHLEHLYYGDRLLIQYESDADVLRMHRSQIPGNTIAYDASHPGVTLENLPLEFSAFGKGDVREPFVELIHADGGRTCDFVYESDEVRSVKTPLEGLPSAFVPDSYPSDGEAPALELHIYLRERGYNVLLELIYTVFERHDVICRSSKIYNLEDEPLTVKRLLSAQLDFNRSDYTLTTFGGAWAREMERFDHTLTGGKIVNSSVCGTSSNRANPFVMLAGSRTTEDAGICYGLNLIYSGNHYEACEVGAFGGTRLVSGINPTGFSWTLGCGESFQAPEAVMTYSSLGYGGMSRTMHRFVRDCIVRGYWAKRLRPVLLNSWEANYFDISRDRLLRLASKAKDVGIELFVMDDGWFGKRDNDTSSLGDWTPNEKKLKGSLASLSQNVRRLGLRFGLWIEPEMVNVDSDLYRAHPDWVLQIPGHEHSEGRTQRVLDLANPAVVEHLTQTFSGLLSSANISYVKWDMNRIMSDSYSPYLASLGISQGETAHRYMLGLYKLMDNLMGCFPEILFEGCASGGNRFDLGMLCYFPQIWASDNTDALCRFRMMTNYSYGYPMNTLTAHVSSCPNHQTLRTTPLTSRFGVAAFGVCGYECNLADMSSEELAEIKAQIEIYKEWRKTLQFGDFYRGGACEAGYNRRSGSISAIPGEWTVVARDKQHAVGLSFQELVTPNNPNAFFAPKGLTPEKCYHFYNRALRYNIKEFGDLVNTASPVHIRQGGVAQHLVSKLMTMPGEVEDYKTSGSVLMAGVNLKQNFTATGYDDETRLFQDFACRMYFMEEE